MIQINKDLCTGCGACVSICSSKAIEMVNDERGFGYPKIDTLLCIDCKMCNRVCHLNSYFFSKDEKCIDSYFGRIKDKKILNESSSGGAFTAISSYYIDKGYCVYGARFNNDLKVYHDYVTNKEDLKFLRKSKYIQSDMFNCFEEIYHKLYQEKNVLFSGVSCQIAALKAYLKTKNISDVNLVTLNVLCHGVSNQTLFDMNVRESKIIGYQFRNKWKTKNTRTALVTYKNGKKKIKNINSDLFLRGYYSKLFYRDSCYNCKYARRERISDFTIFDAWNIEKIKPDINPVEGYSIILFNTEKSKESFNSIFNNMNLEKIDKNWALSSQRLFSYPTKSNKNRDLFFCLLPTIGFRLAVFFSTYKTFYGKVKDFLYYRIKK